MTKLPFLDENSYRPLPYFLEIKKSLIHDLGLFAKEDIEVETEIGITHIFDPRFIHNFIRTPLGGFYNHSETPNVVIKKRQDFKNIEIHCRVMIAGKRILKGEEIVASYSLYKINSYN